jgi:hypothetical protein
MTATEATVPVISGIGRFPTELLLDIFVHCWHSFTPNFEEMTTASFETEIARLAHAPLLDVSHVCTKWRGIAMGTPFLWCDIELDGALWDTPSHIETALALLQLTLDRGGTSPLNLSLTQVVDLPFPPTALEMLAAHSQRWQKFVCPLSVTMVDAFSAIQGQLPHLQSLQIDPSDDENGTMDIFDPLPSLKSLTFPAPFLEHNMDDLPLEHLCAFRCTFATQYEAPEALLLMSRLPRATQFRLEWWSDTSDWREIDFFPLTSNISTFYIQILGSFHLLHSKLMLSSMLASLTLPLLDRFELETERYPHFLIIWPHTEFLALAARSGFDTHLRSLEIFDVQVTEAQLLECLSSLPSLERLAISDHQTVDDGGGVDEHLITDSLFTKLNRTPDSPCLVPRLSSFGCQTLLRFDDQALLALAVSRLDGTDRGQNVGRFQLELSWLPGHERPIDEEVLTRLRELNISTRRRFVFRFSAAENEWI